MWPFPYNAVQLFVRIYPGTVARVANWVSILADAGMSDVAGFVVVEGLEELSSCMCFNGDPVLGCLEVRNYLNLKMTLRKHAYSNILKNFTTKNWQFFSNNILIFSYFYSKHRLWVSVKTALSRRF